MPLSSRVVAFTVLAMPSLCCQLITSANAATLDGAAITELLLARDAQFDNASLIADTTKLVELEPGAPNDESEAKYHIEKPSRAVPDTITVYNETILTKRGGCISVSKTVDRARTRFGKNGMFVSPYHAYGWCGGLAKEINNRGRAAEDKLMMVYPGVNTMQEYIVKEAVTLLEFGHGFGFGKQIQQIDSIDDDLGHITITGKALLVPDSEYKFIEAPYDFSLRLDEAYIVREATFTGQGQRFVHTIKVTTKGTAGPAPLKMAKAGEVRSYLTKVPGGEIAKDKHFHVHFKRLETNLSDETFRLRTEFIASPKTHVFDAASGEKYRVDERGEVGTVDDYPVKPVQTQ